MSPATNAELERKLASASSAQERRAAALEFLEAEAGAADARATAARTKLRETLAKEGVAEEQLAKHKQSLDTLEQQLTAANVRAEIVRADLSSAQALENRRESVKKQVAALDADLAQLGAALGAKEAVWRSERAVATERTALLEDELRRLTEAKTILEGALTKARELLVSAVPDSRPTTRRSE